MRNPPSPPITKRSVCFSFLLLLSLSLSPATTISKTHSTDIFFSFFFFCYNLYDRLLYYHLLLSLRPVFLFLFFFDKKPGTERHTGESIAIRADAYRQSSSPPWLYCVLLLLPPSPSPFHLHTDEKRKKKRITIWHFCLFYRK